MPKTAKTKPSAYNKIAAGLEDAIAFAKGDKTRGRLVTVKPRPQPTIVHVKVVTRGPVPMKAVRKWIQDAATYYAISKPNLGRQIDGHEITLVSVKRDASIERPNR